ncbi:hypothetical protein [Caulobacter vibrioides]|uniref:Uncharacterized protein n=2 Tax=Caulobacter vibrioides TaxID=155892 RepID=Q9A571_CAUVC|nr:hypothetical protein [Caulobacter vibrioides]YP_002518049.1 hypothetical protein CCNA_02676 [Caulobacter vibrioides NA1000]AAK24562.1 hypothetical protein CC_2593 [Caulobacter vibrioides CB15]ACL96141.1 hypothetical protein CCNA_02676 [Caulobacter vibrioides NA1000]ATC25580.1 hypothetical protein CA608_14070 [Caulobacter vibrioides]ATC29441.1 hypothetical protein CA607_14020 [Caulobacter vibrioides]PLR14542.1 hypothetical protein CVUC_05035 [Caulobacter vibrioides]
MAKFSASDAAFSGFRLVRENLKTVGIWIAVMTVVSIIANALTIHFFGAQMEAAMTLMSNPDGASPEEMTKLADQMIPTLLWTLPYNLVVQGVTLAALNRMIQRRDDNRFAFLRVGKDELLQIAVSVLTGLLLMAVFFGGALLTGVLSAVGGGLLGVLVLLGAILGAIYLLVRLSLASAMTFDKGEIVFFRSMSVTKGAFWSLLGAYLVAVVMSMIVWLLIVIIVYAAVAIVTGDFSAAGGALRADTTSLSSYFTPSGIVQQLFSGFMAVLSALIMLSPAPTIYREMTGGQTASEGWGG